VYLRERSQTYYITRCPPRSISASSAFRNVSPEVLALSFSRENEEKNMGLASKRSTIPRITTEKLSS